jgi:hypothetical protein
MEMNKLLSTTLALTIVAALPQVIWAQDLECGPRVQKAQTTIDKVTDDMKGMQGMPKGELLQIHALLDDARMYVDAARRSCDTPQTDYDRAVAIGKADAASGYATAADMLHFHFMKGSAGMKGMHDMGSGSMGSMKGMGGMK